MNQQEIFNQVVKGLASQGFQQSGVSYVENHISCKFRGISCKFRGDKGMKCALGHLVTDEELAEMSAKANRDGREPPAYMVSDFLLKKFGSTSSVEALSDGKLLWEMQIAHDNGRSPESMKKRLNEVAKRFGLTAPSELDTPKTE